MDFTIGDIVRLTNNENSYKIFGTKLKIGSIGTVVEVFNNYVSIKDKTGDFWPVINNDLELYRSKDSFKEVSKRIQKVGKESREKFESIFKEIKKGEKNPSQIADIYNTNTEFVYQISKAVKSPNKKRKEVKTKADLIIEYATSGKYNKYKDIANALNCSRPYVGRVLQLAGINIRKNNREKIIEAFKSNRFSSMLEIAKYVNCSLSLVSLVLKNNNLRFISKKEKIIEAINNGIYDLEKIANQVGSDIEYVKKVILLYKLSNPNDNEKEKFDMSILSDNAYKVAKSRYFMTDENWKKCTERVASTISSTNKATIVGEIIDLSFEDGQIMAMVKVNELRT